MWVILIRSDGFSKRELWPKTSLFSPMIYQFEYQNRLTSFNPDSDPSTGCITRKIIFKFKEWIASDVAVYEEIS